MKRVTLPRGQQITLVPRSQLRCAGRRLRLQGQLPTPPASFDWTKGGSLSFPVLGNDRYGDCWYAASCHGSQTMTGNVGAEDAFDAAAVIKYYTRLSGGDNGLSDAQMMGEWKRGLVGGPHKILDYLVIDATNDAAVTLAMWKFGGVGFTLGIPDDWLTSAEERPGAVWDAGPRVRPDDNNGHAVWLNGTSAAGYTLQTWGFRPPVTITRAGVRSCDPEVVAVFSLDWFDPATGLTPLGDGYDALAALWAQLGGHVLPPSPFGPAPPPPPPPPPPGGFTIPASGTYLLENTTGGLVKLTFNK